MSNPPKKRQNPTPNLTAPPEVTHAGKLFRVRCKDWSNVWGENLSHEDASKLKEQIAASGKSRTVRVEDMSIEPPSWTTVEPLFATGKPAPVQPSVPDPELEAMREKAKTASKEAAKAAQQRHQLAAARDRSSPAAARPKDPRPVPVISTEVPEEVAGDGDDEGPVDADISDLMANVGDQPSDVDMARAKEAANREIAEITAKAKALYDAQKAEGSEPWENLGTASQAGWRFEATRVERAAATPAPDAVGA